MNKILLASVAAVLATLSFASTSQAGSRHHDGFFNVEINLGYKPKRLHRVQREVYFVPRQVDYDNGYQSDIGYDDDRDEPVCTVRTKVKINRWGERVIKKIETCR